jgi:3-oxoacyl-[acyl-carrier protein] reductase
MQPLENRVAVVTGGSRGIGAAIVRRLAADGAHVVFTHAQTTEAAERLVAELGADRAKVRTVQVDQGDGPAMAAMIRDVQTRYGRLDIFVLSAGFRCTTGWMQNRMSPRSIGSLPSICSDRRMRCGRPRR